MLKYAINTAYSNRVSLQVRRSLSSTGGAARPPPPPIIEKRSFLAKLFGMPLQKSRKLKKEGLFLGYYGPLQVIKNMVMRNLPTSVQESLLANEKHQSSSLLSKGSYALPYSYRVAKTRLQVLLFSLAIGSLAYYLMVQERNQLGICLKILCNLEIEEQVIKYFAVSSGDHQLPEFIDLEIVGNVQTDNSFFAGKGMLIFQIREKGIPGKSLWVKARIERINLEWTTSWIRVFETLTLLEQDSLQNPTAIAFLKSEGIYPEFQEFLEKEKRIMGNRKKLLSEGYSFQKGKKVEKTEAIEKIEKSDVIENTENADVIEKTEPVS